jgi:uncharacterized protein
MCGDVLVRDGRLRQIRRAPMTSRITGSPMAVRVAPYVVFLVLTFCQGQFGPGSQYWFYLAKTIAGAAMIWVAYPFIEEMRWKWSWQACAVGVAVFAMWVGLDSYYPKVDEVFGRLGWSRSNPGDESVKTLWNPTAQFGAGSGLAWFFIGVRIIGSSLVVPPLEEVFFRSFLYRYLAARDFHAVPLGLFRLTPFLAGAVLFGMVHNQWLAGILCGLIYQGLVCLKGRLGDAITAHATTNFLLGLWVVWRGDWQFW